MKKIALDFHDTLSQMTVEMLSQIPVKDVSSSHSGIKGWKHWKYVGIDKERFFEIIDNINFNGGNERLTPVENNIGETLMTLSCYYPDIHIVTAAPPEAIPSIKNWLKNNACPDFPIHSVGIGKTQGNKKLVMDYDIFIDDNPHIARNCPKDKYAILYSQPWNESEPVNNINTFRANDWSDVIRIVHTIQGVL